MLLDERTIKRITEKYISLKSKRETYSVMLSSETEKKERLSKRYTKSLEARNVLQEVAIQTQRKIENEISKLVSMALAIVFPDPYKFVVEFEQKRGKTECNLLFEKNGERMRPLDSSGGGAIDVASFALRVAFWSIRKCRPIFILDEPFRFLSRNLQPKASEMLKYLADKLNLQIILVTHIEELISSADEVFTVN